MPRGYAVQYVFTASAGVVHTLTSDEVALTDGTLLHGLADPNADGFAIEHTRLGSLALPASLIRSVTRHPNSVVYLAERPFRTVETQPLITQSVRPGVIRHPRVYGAASWVKGVRVHPTTSLSYRLPDASGKTRVFRTGLQPIPGSRGDVHLRVSVGGRTLHERQLAGGQPWLALSLELPAGSDLTIAVSFGKHIRFPCGLILCDPHVTHDT